MTKLLILAILLFGINAFASVKIKTTKLPDALVGHRYSFQFEAEPSKDSNIAWTEKGLPDGLTMSIYGKIEGTPARKGTYTVEVKAQEAKKVWNGIRIVGDTKTFELVVR